MAKLDPLTTITSGFNSTAQLNDNFTKIDAAFTNTLSRDGSTPNQMDAVIDMNSNRIINLLDPVDNQDAVTKLFLTNFTSGDVDIAAAAASAAAALVSETNAATSETNAALVENSQITFTFDTSTSMADPGAGNFRYNNATVSSVTEIAFDATMAQTGNPDVSDYIATWDDSTNAITGHVTFSKRGNSEVFAIFNVSSVTDNTGWLQVTVTHVSSSGTFSASDTVDIAFARAGDTGGTLVSADITGQASATIALGDSFVFTDVNDSDNLKKDTIQGIVDLVSAGGGTLIDVQTFTASGTWTKPANTASVEVVVVGAGGGGGGSGGGPGNGGTGGTSSFGAHASSTGGSGGPAASASNSGGGAGGIGSGGDASVKGGGGGAGINSEDLSGVGGSSSLGGGGHAPLINATGNNGGTYGGGGSGAASTGSSGSGGGGGGGTSLEHITTGLGATETVTIGAAGVAGTGLKAGGAGAAGIIIVKSFT